MVLMTVKMRTKLQTETKTEMKCPWLMPTNLPKTRLLNLWTSRSLSQKPVLHLQARFRMSMNLRNCEVSDTHPDNYELI
jgi:hypothetical protein